MLTPPVLAPASVTDVLRDAYGLAGAEAVFLPLGADAHTAVFRVDAVDGARHFLKLRSAGHADAAAVELPAFLHHGLRIGGVMAPHRTRHGGLSVRRDGFDWMLYPFVDGENGFARPLSEAQWRQLGATLRAVHDARLPPGLHARLSREDDGERWRSAARRHQRALAEDMTGDALVRQFTALWRAHAEAIGTVLGRSETLAARMRQRPLPLVPCHADLHGGNVLVHAQGDAVSIVDWDTACLAPRERDLMFIGGGVGGVWNDARENALFQQGYGDDAPATDALALCHYRYQRIVVDLVEFCDMVFDHTAGADDRRQCLDWMASQFDRGNVVEMAQRAFEALPGPEGA